MTVWRQDNQTIVGRSFAQQQNYQTCPNVHNIVASDTSAHILHSTMTVSFTKKIDSAIIFQRKLMMGDGSMELRDSRKVEPSSVLLG